MKLHILAYLLSPSQLSMTLDTGLSKEEDDDEDDTMQNTVVLFSNTDKFVLLQVHLLFDVSKYFISVGCFKSCMMMLGLNVP